MVVVLDEGKGIAQAADEVWIGTEHALGAMSQVGVSTSGLLQRYGITPTAMTGILADQALAKRTTTQDWVTLAKQGQLTPVYYRQSLLRDLVSLLTLSGDRDVILVGPAGVGKRTLVYSLALLVAEGKGPDGVKSVVEISERALLDNAPQAVQAGLRQAAGGVLFVPNIQRFLGGYKAEFAQAEKALQKAFLEDATIVIGTTTEADYNERMASISTITDHAHVLHVPPATLDETVAILGTPSLASSRITSSRCESDALQVAASLAGRYLTTTAAPRRGDAAFASRLRARADESSRPACRSAPTFLPMRGSMPTTCGWPSA